MYYIQVWFTEKYENHEISTLYTCIKIQCLSVAPLEKDMLRRTGIQRKLPVSVACFFLCIFVNLDKGNSHASKHQFAQHGLVSTLEALCTLELITVAFVRLKPYN